MTLSLLQVPAPVTPNDSPSQGSSPTWYRTPVPPAEMKQLCRRSDTLGMAQTLGYLTLLMTTGGATWLAWNYLSWPFALAFLFLHGACSAFLVNAIHELGHGTVFRIKWLNDFFVRVFSFLAFFNYEVFRACHARHHRYTLHPPDDLEVVLPMKAPLRDFFLYGIVDLHGLYHALKGNFAVSLGRFRGDWVLLVFPASAPEKRKPPMAWARLLLLGHGSLLAASFLLQSWFLPVLITLAPFLGRALQLLCNHTQHIGLQDRVPDFRLCCRTVILHPFLQFLYWHMNYHIEHHMFPAVPCYRLGRLHQVIRHDLPSCPAGLIAAWREIAAIQLEQKSNPDYQFRAALPHPHSTHDSFARELD